MGQSRVCATLESVPAVGSEWVIKVLLGCRVLQYGFRTCREREREGEREREIGRETQKA